MSSVLRPLTCLALAGLLAVAIGCNKGSSTSAPAAAPGTMGPPGMPGGGPPGPVLDVNAEPHSAGKKAMAASGCFRCHAINGARPAMAGGPPMGRGGPPGPPEPGPGGPPGQGGPGPGGSGPGGRGPDLGHEGQDATHTVEWITKFVRDPKSVKPDAKMPPQNETKISDADLKVVAEYLTSLK